MTIARKYFTPITQAKAVLTDDEISGGVALLDIGGGATSVAIYQGRILRGLDCSGWINWVYWSATGKSLAGESTGSLIGCGKRINRSALRPGDIIIRTGADSHVVMFLGWIGNGNFIGIHETGGVRNNVVVGEMTASWPYYRALLD